MPISVRDVGMSGFPEATKTSPEFVLNARVPIGTSLDNAKGIKLSRKRRSIYDYIASSEEGKTENKYCRKTDLRNEASVESFFVNRLLKDLGYRDQEIRTKESIAELVISAGGRRKEKFKPDYVIICAGEPRWLLDAKAPDEDIDNWYYQCAGYAHAINSKYKGEKPLRYFAITNGLVFKLFLWDEEGPILTLRFSDFMDGNPKFAALRSDIAPEKARMRWKKASERRMETIVLEKPSIPQVKRIFRRCHQIIWKTEKMSPQAAFFEFVKVMFVKLWEDRRIHEDETLGPLVRKGKPIPQDSITFSTRWIDSLAGTTENPVDILLFQPLVKALHEGVVRRVKKPIFDDNAKIRLQPGTIRQVVSRMQSFDLFGIDEDLNGRLFETFLSATMRGKALGQFFTPRTIVKLMTKMANPRAARDHIDKVLDGCCGTAGFLIEIMTEMRRQIRENTSLSDAERKNLWDKISNQSIFGIDAGRDPPIARIARINMYLHGDGGSRIYSTDALDKTVSTQMIEETQAKLELEELRDLLINKEMKFNIVITNPPFAMDYSEALPLEKEVLQHYDLGSYGMEDTANRRKSLKSSLMFLERYYDLLLENGRLITVIDDSILSGRKYKYARDFIRDRFIIRAVVSLHGDAFQRAGARAKTSILYLIKRSERDTSQPNVFMAESIYIGRDDVPSRTPPSKAEEAKDNAEEEIKNVAQAFTDYLNGKKGDWLVPASRIRDRLDVKSCLPRKENMTEKWTAQGIEVVSLGKIVALVWEPVEPHKRPNELFDLLYITYEGIAEEKPWKRRLGKELSYNQMSRVKPNDIVISNINAVRGAIGIIPNHLNHVVASPEFTILRVRDERFNPFYLWNFLRSPEVRARLISRSTGVGRHRIKWEEDLQPLPVPLLSPEKQARISELSKDMIESLRRITRNKKDVESILNENLDLENEWAIKRLRAAKPPR